MKKVAGRLIVAGLLAGMAMGAFAQQAQMNRGGGLIIETRTVSFSDLDLRKPAGAAMLHWRLRMAVKEVCTQGDRGLRARQHERNCREQALGTALAQVSVPSVAAHHADWVAAGSKWLARPSLVPAQRVAAIR